MIEVRELRNGIERALPVLRILRTGPSGKDFVGRFRTAVQHGYRLLLARDGDKALGCLGIRITHDIHWGKTLFVDDLVVAPDARGQGIGAALMKAAKGRAIAEACDHIRLCSGLDRKDAHRFYEQNGMKRASLQFAYALGEGTN